MRIKYIMDAVWKIVLIAGLLKIGTFSATVGNLDVDSISVPPPISVHYDQIGKIKPRHTKDIPGSGWGLGKWSIGGETMDRDYTLFKEWSPYLGPLGAKAVRLQSGWAKTEKEIGVYDWAWLDTIVNGVVAQGVEPWITICYANPVYGGGIKLHTDPAEILDRDDARQAWVNYVTALVDRYKDKVKIWEIWNEPPKEGYLEFFELTAEAIRSKQSESINLGYHKLWDELEEKGKAHLQSGITFHGYPEDPDGEGMYYGHKLDDERKEYQGETGCPSQYGGFGMLGKKDWLTETIQAKWDLRRMLNYTGRGQPANLFAIMDMKYRNTYDTTAELRDFNYKGLIKANPDRTVHHLKEAYYATQHLFTIFDETLENITDRSFDFEFEGIDKEKMMGVGMKKKLTGELVVPIWKAEGRPVNGVEMQNVKVTFTQAVFVDPVYVDLRTGAVFEIPEEEWSVDAGTKTTTFQNVPIYDSPVLLMERNLVFPLLTTGLNEIGQDGAIAEKKLVYSNQNSTPTLSYDHWVDHSVTISSAQGKIVSSFSADRPWKLRLRPESYSSGTYFAILQSQNGEERLRFHLP